MEQRVLEKKYNRWIIVLSVAIPLVVALLFGVNLRKLGFDVQPLTFLPPIYATINGITAVLLVIAVWAIKKRETGIARTAGKNSGRMFGGFSGYVRSLSHDIREYEIWR